MLTALYDLEISPLSFDFCDFLVLSEVERERSGADDIHVVIVPGKGDKIAPNSPYDLDQIYWRVRNILVPCCHLLPTCRKITVCKSRIEAERIIEAAEGELFPTDYDVNQPGGSLHHGWCVLQALQGIDLQALKAPAQARSYIDQWITESQEKREVVSLTLRTSEFVDGKNSNLDNWAGFAEALVKRGFAPVIVPDTDVALHPADPRLAKYPILAAAAFNIELRCALYERCLINFFVSNGPASICAYNRHAAYVQFISGVYLSDPMACVFDMNLPHGANPPYLGPSQRWIWDEDTTEILTDAFEQMCARTSGAQIDYPRQVQNLEFLEVLLTTQSWDRFDSHGAYLLERMPGDPNLLYLLGKGEAQRSDPKDNTDRATENKYFSRLVAVLTDDREDQSLDHGKHEILVDTLVCLGDWEKAEEFAAIRIAEYPNDPEGVALLARVLILGKREPEAVEICRSAMVRGLNDACIIKEMATALKNLGRLIEAAELYEKLIMISGADASSYLEYGLILEALDRNQEAIATYQCAKQANMAGFEILYRLALCLRSVGNLQGAVICLEELLEENYFKHGSPNWTGGSQLFLLLGDTYLELGETAQALNWFKLGRAKFPSEPEFPSRISELI